MVREIQYMSKPKVLSSLYNNNEILYKNEETLNSLLEIAANIYDCNIGLICIYYKKQFYVKAVYGIGDPNQIKTFTFCNHAIQTAKPFYILNAALDATFAESPIVKFGPKLRFVAGTPLLSDKGELIGSICVASNKERNSFDVNQLHYLTKLSKQVTNYLMLNNAHVNLQNEKKIITDRNNLVSKTLLNEYDTQDEFLAHELHENFAQTLAATKSYLESLSVPNEISPQMIKQVKDNINGVLSDVKKLSHSILPSTLSHENYAPLLQDFLQQFSKDQQIKIKSNFAAQFIPEDVTITGNIFKILHYSLKNIHHRKAQQIDINFNRKKEMLFIEFTEDGISFMKQPPVKEKYLDSLHARIAIENGTITRKRIKGKLNYTKISIPLKNTL
jgi:hypothetical protein